MRSSRAWASGSVAAVWQGGPVAGLTDEVLLDRFLTGPAEQAEAAFAALVERHAPLVLHVCRQRLRDGHDAEDAAQATFLILARQARSIRRAEALASWLYGVSGRVAARVRRAAERRRRHEQRGGSASWVSRQARGADPLDSDSLAALHAELDRLPDRFRLPILLCHLEGLTHEQAAAQLGCPVRTIQSRLSRGRQRLRDRLVRRGSAPALLPSLLDAGSRPLAVGVGAAWTQVLAQAAVRSVGSGPLTAVVSARVAGLVQGVSRVMLSHQIGKWAVALAVLGGTVGGARTTLQAWSAPAPVAIAPVLPAAVAPVPSVVDDRWRVKTTGGASIEVVAISTVPTGPNTWWRPDGTRLLEPPVDSIEARTETIGGELDRVVLVRVLDLQRTDMFRWFLTSPVCWGGQAQRDGRNVPELEYYEATFAPSTTTCGLSGRVATGPWKTEVSNNGKGGFGTFVNNHKFTFGKARPITTVFGKPGTNFAVAHNFFNQDRRLVAIDQVGTPHTSVADSIGSDGNPKWQVDLIDAEFDLRPDQIRTYEVQFRPFEEVEIPAIPLHPAP